MYSSIHLDEPYHHRECDGYDPEGHFAETEPDEYRAAYQSVTMPSGVADYAEFSEDDHKSHNSGEHRYQKLGNASE